ncbi:hypothetical protein [Brevibacillus laterosporus]|uniref:hypothetical protein n=1 Tax=Brevibacillus laterosporus TaxID=1465 RepID=UPI0005530086|nr:hypothetical protein [Brevibacillus laterosporus]
MNFRLVTFVLLLSLVSQTILTPFQAFAASDELSTISKSEAQKKSLRTYIRVLKKIIPLMTQLLFSPLNPLKTARI